MFLEVCQCLELLAAFNTVKRIYIRPEEVQTMSCGWQRYVLVPVQMTGLATVQTTQDMWPSSQAKSWLPYAPHMQAAMQYIRYLRVLRVVYLCLFKTAAILTSSANQRGTGGMQLNKPHSYEEVRPSSGCVYLLLACCAG